MRSYSCGGLNEHSALKASLYNEYVSVQCRNKREYCCLIKQSIKLEKIYHEKVEV